MLRLLTIKWLCFLILEADRWARVPGGSPLTLGSDLLTAAGVGTLLPVSIAVLLEVCAAGRAWQSMQRMHSMRLGTPCSCAA